MEQLKQPIRYIFLKTCLQEEVKHFRAKHVFQWLKAVHPEGKAYYQQVHAYILRPLLEANLITKDEDSIYTVADDAEERLDEASVKKRGKKPREVNGVEQKLIASLETTGYPTEDKEEGEVDEWERHIREKMKTLKSTM